MKVNDKERLVVIVIIAIVVPIAAIFLFDRVSSSFASREMAIKQQRTAAHTHNLNITKSKLAIQRLREYEKQALSSDSLTARASLQAWLASTEGEFFLPDTVQVRPISNRPLRDEMGQDIGEHLSYRLSGRGDIQQLTRFLHRFYSMKTLHRISTLTIAPREDSKLLDLVFIVDALSLNTSAERVNSEQALRVSSEQSAVLDAVAMSAIFPFASVPQTLAALNTQTMQTTKVSNKLWRDVHGEPALDRFAYADHSYFDYADAILRRNLFGEVNTKPTLASVSDRRGTTNRPYTVSIKASDPDPFDNLAFSLVGQASNGAQLRTSPDGKSAELTFTPPKPGKYEFTVAVVDDGLPTKQDEVTFEVAVEDPPAIVRSPPPDPPQPKFDFAKYTEVQAFLRGRDGSWEVWLHVKPQDPAPRELRVGDTFEIGTVKGKVREIGPKSTILEVNGEPREFQRGDVLTGGSPLPEI